MNKYWQVLILIILAVGAVFLIPHRKATAPAAVTDFASCEAAGGSITDGDPVTCTYNGYTFAEQEVTLPEVVVNVPEYGAVVTSPLKVIGRARGSWFFEANIPATLKDSTGKVLVQQGLTAASDWMTTDYVSFEGTLVFDPGTAETGVLIINKDNPSGDPARDSSFAVPVRFK